MRQSVHKPTLSYLCTSYGVSALDLAKASNMSISIVLAILVGYAMTRETAEAFLRGLNALNGTAYTIDDVRVDLVEGRNGDA